MWKMVRCLNISLDRGSGTAPRFFSVLVFLREESQNFVEPWPKVPLQSAVPRERWAPSTPLCHPSELLWLQHSCSGGRSVSASHLEWISGEWTWNEWLCTGTGAQFPSLPGSYLQAEKADRCLTSGLMVNILDIKHSCSIATTSSVKTSHLSKLPKSSHYREGYLGFRGADAQVHWKLNQQIF